MNKQTLDRLKKEGMHLKLSESCRHALYSAKVDCEEASKDGFKTFRQSLKKARQALEDAECLLNEIESL